MQPWPTSATSSIPTGASSGRAATRRLCARAPRQPRTGPPELAGPVDDRGLTGQGRVAGNESDELHAPPIRSMAPASASTAATALRTAVRASGAASSGVSKPGPTAPCRSAVEHHPPTAAAPISRPRSRWARPAGRRQRALTATQAPDPARREARRGHWRTCSVLSSMPAMECSWESAQRVGVRPQVGAALGPDQTRATPSRSWRRSPRSSNR